MFREVENKALTAEGIKNHILAYASLTESDDEMAKTDISDYSSFQYSAEVLKQFPLYLALSGIADPRIMSQDAILENTTPERNSDQYIYLKDEIFVQEANSLNDQDFIKKMYRTFLKRDVDPGGKQSYMDFFSQGKSRLFTVAIIRHSEEAENAFLNATSYLEDEVFLDLAYRICLKREADAGGKSAYTNSLAHGQPRQDVVKSFHESEEFQQVMNRLG